MTRDDSAQCAGVQLERLELQTQFETMSGTASSASSMKGNSGPGWLRTTSILLSYQLGLGVLSLPHAASLLGWVPFFVSLVVLAAGALYSGNLYARLHQACSSAFSLSDVALYGRGTFGEKIVTTITMSFLVIIGPLSALTLVLAVKALTLTGADDELIWMGASVVALALSQPLSRGSGSAESAESAWRVHAGKWGNSRRPLRAVALAPSANQ